jgi:hypothetical protein
MFRSFSLLSVFAGCLLLSACGKDPMNPSANQNSSSAAAVESAKPWFGLSAQETSEARLLFAAVPSKDVVLYNVTITNPGGKSIVFKPGSEIYAAGQRVPLQHSGESHAQYEGLYQFEFQGRLVIDGELSGAFTAAASYLSR